MQKAEVTFASSGDPDLLVWTIPAELAPGDASHQVFPSSEFRASLIEEDDEGGSHPVGEAGSFLVIDCNDSALEGFRKYDPVTDSTENIKPFHDQHSTALPAIG